MTEMLISKSCLTEGMELVNVSTKGQIVIPKAVRKQLRINAGTRMMLVALPKQHSLLLKLEDDDTILTPAEKRAVERARRELREGKGITLDELEKQLGYR